ncbi:MobA/MobL family protein [Rosenbergiella epipactidis]|uniref:MobA/MobL family protein n=1 Tax=Rosenbergiella epipactidis TaxID=1544694 RepID=UPI0030C7C03D
MQRLALVRDFVSQEIGERHAYQFAIHNPKAAIAGGEQPHAHIMFSERHCDGIDRDPEQYFKRANSKNPERGGAKKVRFGETPTERKAYLTEQRSRWADLQNAYLEKYQHDDRVDARSYKAQGIDRQPERHLGPYQVRQLDVAQLQAVIDRREAEFVAVEQKEKLQGAIDVTSSLHSVLRERDEAQRTSPVVEREQRQSGKANQDEINKLVNTAMGDIQQDIDLQSLIDSSMAEFAGIHQQQLKQQEQLKQAKLQKQREVERQKQAEKLKQQQSQQLKPKSRGPRM